MSKNNPPKLFSIRTAAFWICKKEVTDCIVEDDVSNIFFWLMYAVTQGALKVSHKDFCNYTNPEVNIVNLVPLGGKKIRVNYSSIKIAEEIKVNYNDLEVYLDRLLNWLSGKGFKSPYDEKVIFSERLEKLGSKKFQTYEYYLNKNGQYTDARSFSPKKRWIPIIEDAISRLLAEAGTENTQATADKDPAAPRKEQESKKAISRLLQAEVKTGILEKKLKKPKRKSAEDKTLDGIFLGVSTHISNLKEEIKYVAPRDSTVLILGETGTGKELIAGAIRKLSPRWDKPFKTVNCAAIPKDLFESELFGHKKGSFSGATEDKTGLVKKTGDGTLFLDEIGDMSKDHQAKILRFIDQKEFSHVGDNKTENINVRIIAATNKPKESLRLDLQARLEENEIRTEPLANRPEDVVVLLNHFVEKAKIKPDPKAKFLLYSYNFPKNVRELKNLVENQLYSYSETHKKILRGWAESWELDESKVLSLDVDYLYKLCSGEIPIKGKVPVKLDAHERKTLENFNLNVVFADVILNKYPTYNYSNIVQLYEIITLLRVPGMTRDSIRNILKISHDKVAQKTLKQLGFRQPKDGDPAPNVESCFKFFYTYAIENPQQVNNEMLLVLRKLGSWEEALRSNLTD